MTNSSEGSRQVDEIRSDIRGFRRAQVYIAFAELELGHALQHGPLEIQQLADSINADPSGLRRFLDAAQAFDLVHIDSDGTVKLSELGWLMYSPSSEESVNAALKLEGAFFRRWGRLAEAVRMGGRPEANRAQEDDPGWVPMFTTALYENARSTARAVASTIEPLLPTPDGRSISVLDLGGGHGGYSIALAELREDIDATVFDLPPVIETTQRIVERSGQSERVSTVAGDFHTDSIGHAFDAILLFGVLHGETPENARRLLSTVRAALKHNGILFIRSQGNAHGESQQGERELFDLQMLLSTAGGQVRRSAGIRKLVSSQGFRLDQQLEIKTPGKGLVLAFRPD